MPYLETDTHRVRYVDQGGGTPVILLHSSGASAGQWRKLIEDHADRYRFLAPDLVGYGGTEPLSDQPYTPVQELAIVEKLVALAGKAPHLVGHSFGGGVALDAGRVLGDRVQSVTAIEPVLFDLLPGAGEADAWAEIEAVASNHVRLVEANANEEAADGFMGYWVGTPAWQAMPEPTRAYIIGTMPKIADEWRIILSRSGSAEDYQAITAPIHLIHASNTTLSAARVTEVLLRSLPKAQSSEVQEAGHLSPITHPQVVNRLILDGIDRASRS